MIARLEFISRAPLLLLKLVFRRGFRSQALFAKYRFVADFHRREASHGEIV
jgi:hypothetical protein